MSKPKKSTIEVQGTAIAIVSSNDHDFMSLTDMAKKFGDDSTLTVLGRGPKRSLHQDPPNAQKQARRAS